MRGLTADEIKAIDDFTINTIGIPSLVLMERAALEVTESITRDFDHHDITVICGTGNNGGDGIAIGRLLHQMGKQVSLYLVGDFSQASKETKVQLQIAKQLKMTISESSADFMVDSQSLIIDALFGIGLNREVEEPQLSIINKINTLPNNSVAVDIPSGLSADSGLVYNKAVKAKKTYTIGFWKQGFENKRSRIQTGDIDILDIGYPPADLYKHILEREESHD